MLVFAAKPTVPEGLPAQGEGLIALVAGKADLSKLAFTVGSNPPTTFPYSAFLSALIAFVLVAAAVFFLVVRPINALMARRRTEPEVESTTRECPECLSSIPGGAGRCPSVPPS